MNNKTLTDSYHPARHWIILTAVLVTLLLPSYLITEQEKNSNNHHANQQLLSEIKLLTTLIEKYLHSGDYVSTQSVLEEWINNYPDTTAITLTTKSGFTIAEIKKDNQSTHLKSTSSNIKYGYHGEAELQLTRDNSWIAMEQMKLQAFVASAWLLAALFGIYMVRNMHQHHKENTRLQKLSNKIFDTNERLIKEKQLQRSIMDSIPDHILIKDTESRYMGSNKAFDNYVGLSENKLLGKSDFDFFDQELAVLSHSNEQLILKSGESRRSEDYVTYPDGRQVLMDTLKTPYYDLTGKLLGLIAISRDITEIKNYQNQLEQLAYHDPLTQLPNRRFLMDRMELAIASSRRRKNKFAVLALDLDGFKPVNDNMGHEAGDRIIVEFANRLNNSLRSGDTVARWGGDEFTLLFSDIDNNNEYIELVERLQHLIAIPYSQNGETINLTASIGMTIFPDDNSDADTLLRHADQAMYSAKLSGKNQYHFFDPEQDKILHNHRENRNRIEEAIFNSELVLYFHPQIHLRQGAPYGVEALVRWNHPEKGILPPGAFLPYIEDHSLNIDLDWWVLGEAVKQLSSWISKGDFFHMSINVSAITFQQKDFLPRLQNLFAMHHEICAEMISLELLETAALGNLEQIAEKMRACQKLGLQFSLDDFGTGYSSLTYLSRLPANILKIDQSFVRDMLVDSGDASIVEGIIRLASAFDRMVIAEGVEEILHGLKLIEMGCNYAQGYAIAKPMPADKLQEWLTHFKAPAEWTKYSQPNLAVLDGGANGQSQK